MNKISLVLPLKINTNENGSDLERVKMVLLPSLVKYFDLSQIDKFLIITTVSERQMVASALDDFKHKMPLEIVVETEILQLIPGWIKHRIVQKLLGPLRKVDYKFNKERFFKSVRLYGAWGNFGGWLKQQLLKLAASRLIETDYYMTLDSDLCLTRRADLSVLLPGGKAIYSPDKVAKHDDWWAGSARVLDVPLKLKSTDTGMGVTPEILSTRVARELVDYLAGKAKDKGFFTIFEYLGTLRTWTEYTLYWLFLLEFYKKDDYYSSENLINTIHWDYCVWYRNEAPDRQALDERIRGAFGDDRGLFLVIQSNCIPFPEYRDAVKGYL